MRTDNNDDTAIEILIAEDSPTQAERLRYLIESHGYTVTSAPDGRQALEAARRCKPALIVSDVVMPEMDGFTLCGEIKRDAKLKDVPVILLTTLADVMDIMKGLGCGADNFIRKPYEDRYLLARIDHLLMNSQLRKNQMMQFGVEISLGGNKHFITAERQQILDLLISVYEDAIHLSEELKLREKELARSNELLQWLNRLAEGINRMVSERDVAEMALDRAMEMPGVQAGWICLREGESGLRAIAARNLPPSLALPGTLEGNCACRRKLASGDIRSVQTLAECGRLAQAKGNTGGLQSHAIVPLWLGDRTVGEMNLIGPGDGQIDEEERKVLHSVGHQVAVALERARLHEHQEQVVKTRTAALTAEIALREHAQTTEQSLREVRERLEDAQQTARIGDWTHDLGSGRITWSPFLYELLVRDPALGPPDYDEAVSLFEDGSVEVITQAIETVLHSGQPVQYELRVRPSGERPLHVLVTAVPCREADGRITSLRGTLQDISALKELEIRLREAKESADSANRAKSTFLATMSHEIRTPLNAILGYSQLLQRDRDLGPKQRAQIQSILRSGDQLIGLIDDILKISRIEAGRLTLDEAALDLHAMIAELATTFTMRAEQKGLRLIVEYMEDVPRFVFGDESKLRTVFNNLMTNAIKFTDLGGVAVRLHAAPQHEGGFFLEVEIEDSGYGISQIDLPRLFRKFEQADLGKRTSGGTGLGLAISREYVRLMGGELSVDSELGRGSVFRFRVRLSHANPAAIPEVTVARSVKCLRPGQQPFKILIADDIEDNREVLSVLLAQVGFEVRAVNDGDAAIRVFEVWRPQLVLMDMRMPVMDGYEATRRIRALAGSDVVIFAVTASARMEDLADARAVGVDDFVGKPFREAHLLATIGRYLGAEYEYWDAPADAAHAAARIDPAADVPRALLALPQGLRSELRAAAILADVDRMLAILLTVAEHDPALAAALGAITEQYDYARVIALLGIAEEQK